ncbi:MULTISPECIES: cytochrome-c oxidase, cbb3-type subunit III [Simplicispira]|uniref:Cbb3-type cytochrome c oxidase subunit n=1 Tax=Simplicispira metamorpha TaxID=80881 RepID=A0A4V2SJS6_9BURK|nr:MULTISPECIES: cytochrome-c oxidase, cbb3-type subunit III [Simplicispira]MDD2690483.1 cytochrome-c oxidase, cbb3-type subunit III [Simplicispira sp.]TCP16736.1 cytochrome c oxidase cbb3-type subunit 3 [Simplicispira metamorpha]
MSDFTSNFWSVYVAGITIAGIVACLLLLWITARKKVASDSNNTTGHVWDEDLTEMNNPMPRWWMWLFVLTIIFSFAYLAIYPGLGKFAGKMGWSQYGAYDAEMAQAKAELEPLYARFTSMTTEQVAQDPQAMAIGERLFMNNCAQCHGSDARGSKSFPNLTDGDWLHGGTPEKIRETLEKGRIGNMPPMAAAVGSPEDVRNLSHYVLSLSGSPHDSLRASLGKSKFVACAACHGADGKGMQALGAPNLTDDIWLHGWGEAAITAMINNGKVNQMPAQSQKLTEAQLGVLTAYVWGMSNKPGSAR